VLLPEASNGNLGEENGNLGEEDVRLFLG